MTDFAKDAFTLARSDTFTGRLQYLLCQYAKYCASIDPLALPAGRAASKSLAARVLSDPGGMAGKLAVSLVSDPGVRGSYMAGPPVDSKLLDDDLDAVIQAIWNSGAWDNVL